jgi:FMN phosphatase YigB (HAD superfamily)
MAVNTILYDLGRVLLAFDYAPIYAKLSELSGMPVAKFKPFIDINYVDFASGRMTPEEWHTFVCEHMGIEVSFDEFRAFWADIFWPIEEMWDSAHKLHEKYPQYLLSNTDPIHVPWCLSRWPLEEIVDGMILSYEIEAYKPDFRIYERGLAKFGLKAADCVFIDDMPENIAAAKACGLAGIVCESPEQVLRDLAKLGIEV